VATPIRRFRPVNRRRRPFDLRRTAAFFGLLALVVILVGLSARAAAGAVERHPAWALVPGVAGVAVAMALRHGRHRPSVARMVRRAAAALDEGAGTVVDVLDTTSSAGTGAEPPAVDFAGDERVVLPRGVVAAPDALSPEEFEEAVAALCERDGCSYIEVVGGAGDLGADILAVAPDGRRVVIQCKRYSGSHRVGSQDLQRFGGTCFTVHEADVAVVITTSDFTAPAVEYAEQCGIVCWDGQALRKWSLKSPTLSASTGQRLHARLTSRVTHAGWGTSGWGQPEECGDGPSRASAHPTRPSPPLSPLHVGNRQVASRRGGAQQHETYGPIRRRLAKRQGEVERVAMDRSGELQLQFRGALVGPERRPPQAAPRLEQ
jgi:restriction system protein